MVRVSELPVRDVDVLVVGAGPTGLMAALVLARLGVPAVVIDAKAGPTRESRALVVQARSMEIYAQLGLAERVEQEAFRTVRLRIGPGADGPGPEFGRLQTGATDFPGVRVFEQSRNERLLAGALTAAGAEPLWQHRLVDLVDRTDEPDGRVEALVEGDDGTLARIRARWCIGADGASSAVRRHLGVPFEGTTDAASFWVADVRGLRGVPDGVLNLRFGPSTFAVAFPLGPDGHVRLIALAETDGITAEDALAAADAEFGLTHDAVDWFSTYRVHHRVAARFRVGSVFLAGDAGHVHSPIGGQGMNTGLQDAHCLALLLADVARGRVSATTLDRYERERRPVALHLVRVTDRAFGAIGRRGRWAAFLRRRFAALAGLAFPVVGRTPLGRRVGGYLGQYRIRYRFTEPGAPMPGWADDPAVGRRVPPVGENQRTVDGVDWQLHGYGTGAVERPELPEWVCGPIIFGADPADLLRRDRLYLIRPDQFVAAAIPVRTGLLDAAVLGEALAGHGLRVGGDRDGTGRPPHR